MARVESANRSKVERIFNVNSVGLLNKWATMAVETLIVIGPNNLMVI